MGRLLLLSLAATRPCQRVIRIMFDEVDEFNVSVARVAGAVEQRFLFSHARKDGVRKQINRQRAPPSFSSSCLSISLSPCLHHVASRGSC